MIAAFCENLLMSGLHICLKTSHNTFFGMQAVMSFSIFFL
jgi:hypothetical protein